MIYLSYVSLSLAKPLFGSGSFSTHKSHLLAATIVQHWRAQKKSKQTLLNCAPPACFSSRNSVAVSVPVSYIFPTSFLYFAYSSSSYFFGENHVCWCSLDVTITWSLPSWPQFHNLPLRLSPSPSPSSSPSLSLPLAPSPSHTHTRIHTHDRVGKYKHGVCARLYVHAYMHIPAHACTDACKYICACAFTSPHLRMWK